jgi:hypothetical protein
LAQHHAHRGSMGTSPVIFEGLAIGAGYLTEMNSPWAAGLRIFHQTLAVEDECFFLTSPFIEPAGDRSFFTANLRASCPEIGLGRFLNRIILASLQAVTRGFFSGKGCVVGHLGPFEVGLAVWFKATAAATSATWVAISPRMSFPSLAISLKPMMA